MDKQQTTEPLTGSSTTEAKDRGPSKWRSARFTMAYMILLGNAVIFLQRVTFSMAIVCMVNHTALDLAQRSSLPSSSWSSTFSPNHTVITIITTEAGSKSTNSSDADVKFGVPSILTGGNDTQRGDRWGNSGFMYDSAAPGLSGRSGGAGGMESEEERGGRRPEEGGSCDRELSEESGAEEKEDGPFAWDKETQGLLLGAVYWGYMSAQIIAGYALYHFGARRVCFTTTTIMSVLTILCYPAAYLSPWAVFALRVAVGINTAFAIPSFFYMWSKWAPVEERATLLGLSFSGQNVANTLSFPVAALLCKYGFAGGWPSVFCVTGGLGLVWSVAWLLVVSDSPETLTRIHPAERDYIVANRGSSHSKGDKIAVPWCQMFSSSCFWAILVGHVTFTWGLFLFMSNLPLYMYEVMNFDIKSNGLYSMLPYIALGCVQAVSGFSADVLMKKKILNVFWTRRLFYSASALVPAVLLVAMSFLDCQHVAGVMTLLVLAVGFTGFAFSGFLVNPFDIAPRYAISITSVTNAAACVPGILTPYVVAEVTVDKTREQWQIIFFITAAIYVSGTVFFCVFAKTSVQPWAVSTPQVIEVKLSALDPDINCNGQIGEGAPGPGGESEALCNRNSDKLQNDIENGEV